MARVHPRYGTPHAAILLAGLLGTTLVLSRTFEALTSTFVMAIWPFYALSVAGIFRLRRRPDVARPYRVPGYPVVPLIFVGSVLWFVANAIINDPVPTTTRKAWGPRCEAILEGAQLGQPLNDEERAYVRENCQ